MRRISGYRKGGHEDGHWGQAPPDSFGTRYSAARLPNRDSYVLDKLMSEELEAGTELVRLLKDGTPRVTKKDLMQKYGRGKRVAVRETLRDPSILERYRADKDRRPLRPLTHHQVASETETEPPDWDALLVTVMQTPPGPAQAGTYHRRAADLLNALFYPSLAHPRIEVPIHGGRKRVDIAFTNVASNGFFGWLATHYPASTIWVECKNYSREVANEELDQLAGRFSPSRGKFGILLCRSFEDKALFDARCRDTALDDRGFIVALDDGTLQLSSMRPNRGPPQASASLRIGSIVFYDRHTCGRERMFVRLGLWIQAHRPRVG